MASRPSNPLMYMERRGLKFGSLTTSILGKISDSDKGKHLCKQERFTDTLYRGGMIGRHGAEARFMRYSLAI